MSDTFDNVRLTSTRDLPHSFGELLTGWYKNCKKEVIAPIPFVSEIKKNGKEVEEQFQVDRYENLTKKEKRKLKWNMLIATGNLWTDGYIKGSTSTLTTCLKLIYGKQYSDSKAIKDVSSMSFAGICFSQLFFAYWAMHYSRKSGLLLANGMMILFSILTAAAWTTSTTGTHGGDLFNLISAYLFFLGIGVGAEYPLGSSMGSDYSASLPEGQRARWFVLCTNFATCCGYVCSSIVPIILLCICGEKHLQPVWRISIGLCAVAPTFFFIARWKMTDAEKFKKQEFKTNNIPYLLILKFYWFRLLLLSFTWAAFDFSSSGFSTYFSIILTDIAPHMSLKHNFGWKTLLSVVDATGSFLGAYIADFWGPRITASLGATVQVVIGLLMASYLKELKRNSAAFAALYCLFQGANSFGFGNNTFYLCSNSTSSNSKMLFFAIAAIAGKVGSFVAAYVFPGLIARHGGHGSISGLQQPYWVSCSLTAATTIIFFFLFPRIDQASIEQEDAVFHKYLVSQGFDVSTLGQKYRSSKQEENSEFEERDESEKSDESEELKKTDAPVLDVVEVTESL